jgi:hypothetical protein
MLTRSELLDRMEILYPDEPRFSDLRRAYIDRDENSIHRLMTDISGSDIDDLRKAFRDNNWHRIFHLIEGDWVPQFNVSDSVEAGDLRKFLLSDNVWSMYRLLLHIHGTRIVETLKSLHASGTRFDKDALSRGQLLSKMWLIHELQDINADLGTVFLCAGWYGILSTLMFENGIRINKVRSFDIDPDVKPIAEKFNLPWVKDEWKFKPATLDIHDLEYENFEYEVIRSDGSATKLRDTANTVINTSCEHINDFDEWYAKIPSGTMVVLQSNDYDDIEEHVNTSANLYEFAVQTPMQEVYYSGEMAFDKYTRFMRIGIK